MSEIFEKDSGTIGLHLKDIYKSGKLDDFGSNTNSGGMLFFQIIDNCANK